MKTAQQKRSHRKLRNRSQFRKKSSQRIRMSVHRSLTNIYVQVIDDVQGSTVASASTVDKELRDSVKNGGNVDAAVAVGKLVAERAKKAGVTEVAFDRGAYRYHGRVKALADAAREAGLSF
jgi:large subunit ribosomal protein L18